jgi:hypothetical protein
MFLKKNETYTHIEAYAGSKGGTILNPKKGNRLSYFKE